MYIKMTRRVQTWLINTPFIVMLFFGIAHLLVYVQLDVCGKHLSFSFVNQIASMVYLASIYLWALLASKKRFIQITALFMGSLSICCILVSLGDFGNSINDALCMGSAVLTLLYVFDNAQFLLALVKKYDKCLTVSIWGSLLFSIVLFCFFSVRRIEWGEGIFLFGHRYASVCCMMIIIIALKLLNQPKYAFVYWIAILLCYGVCFWTGARIYAICGLGTVYAVIFTFRKSTKDFLIKCIAVTLASVALFFCSSSSTKIDNIVTTTNQALLETESATAPDDTGYVWANALSNGRLFMWKNCAQSYQKLPLINKVLGSGNKYIYVHNIELNSHMDFLNILHFHGILGLIAYLLIFIGYVGQYWRKHSLSGVLLIGLWGVWFAMAFLNGYVGYTANMMSLPYIAVMAMDEGKLCKS